MPLTGTQPGLLPTFYALKYVHSIQQSPKSTQAIGPVMKTWHNRDALEPMTALSWGHALCPPGRTGYHPGLCAALVAAMLCLLELLFLHSVGLFRVCVCVGGVSPELLAGLSGSG